jgi:hypothetical protein
MEPEVGIEPTTYRLQGCRHATNTASTCANSGLTGVPGGYVALGTRSFAPRLMPRARTRTASRPGTAAGPAASIGQRATHLLSRSAEDIVLRGPRFESPSFERKPVLRREKVICERTNQLDGKEVGVDGRTEEAKSSSQLNGR